MRLLAVNIFSCLLFIGGCAAEQQVAQVLPLSAKTTIGDQTLYLEVARTPEQMEKGLMFRANLPKNQGMLFVFEQSEPVSFWMQNVVFPLDVVFIKDDVIQKVVSAPACFSDPCPVFESGVPTDQAIELRAGRVAELGLQVGSRIRLELIQP